VSAATISRNAPRSLLGQLLAALAVLLPATRRLTGRCIPVVREHMTTVAAFAAVNYGAFSAWHHGGWIVLGVSALLLDFKFRG
jgi:hypothetical protein